MSEADCGVSQRLLQLIPLCFSTRFNHYVRFAGVGVTACIKILGSQSVHISIQLAAFPA